MILHVCIVILFVVLGVVFSLGRGSFLIAGYNTMPAEEKEKYDERAVCRFMGKMMFYFALVMCLTLADDLLPGYRLSELVPLLIVAGALFTVGYASTSRKLRKK